MAARWQKVPKFICSALPDNEVWQKLASLAPKEGDEVIKIIMAGEEEGTFTVRRVLNIDSIPLKKDIKYSYAVFLGLIEWKGGKDLLDDVPEYGISYCEIEINHTRKTCRMRIQDGRFERTLPPSLEDKIK